jgi:hypothetical protein
MSRRGRCFTRHHDALRENADRAGISADHETSGPSLIQSAGASISGRLEDIVLEVAAALDVEARAVPLAAARVAGAALPSEAERPA